MDLITLAMAKAYTDKKAGYTETETIYNAKNLALPAGSNRTMFDFTSPIVEGESYIVNLNGVEYEYICVLNSSGAPCLGNIYATGDGNSVNNGEPVGIKFRATGKYIVATIDTSVDRTISVYQRTETVHPIDPKYIPPVDSLTINGTDGKQYKLTVNNGSISVAEVV